MVQQNVLVPTHYTILQLYYDKNRGGICIVAIFVENSNRFSSDVNTNFENWVETQSALSALSHHA